jgi:hypothetical protein
MKSRLVLLSLLLSLTMVMAGDPQFQPSKIAFAKKHAWEALATKWMSPEELKKYVEDTNNDHKQMIFVDFNGVNYRGLFSDKIKYEGWYYVEVFEEKAMSREIAKYKGEGFEPSYIYKNAGIYTAVFVTPGQLPQARKLLDELGIGPATVKK